MTADCRYVSVKVCIERTIKHRSYESFGVLIHLVLGTFWPKDFVILELLPGTCSWLLNGYLRLHTMQSYEFVSSCLYFGLVSS